MVKKKRETYIKCISVGYWNCCKILPNMLLIISLLISIVTMNQTLKRPVFLIWTTGVKNFPFNLVVPLIPALRRQRQGDLWVQGQLGLHSDLQDSQDYTKKPCLKKKTQEITKKILHLVLLICKMGMTTAGCVGLN